MGIKRGGQRVIGVGGSARTEMGPTDWPLPAQDWLPTFLPATVFIRGGGPERSKTTRDLTLNEY
jgi:hypothetical protein